MTPGLQTLAKPSSAPRGNAAAEREPAPGRLSGRSRLCRLTGVQILATGSYVPDEVVTNDDLARLGFDAQWILQRTGIRQRRKAPPEMATSDLAFEAARRCLQNAGVSAGDVDLIVLATMTPDTPAPSTACHLQSRLGASAPAMDVHAACAGFMYALVTAMQFVKSGCASRALVIGADAMTRLIDPADRKTFPLFGDGAGAVLLGPGRASQGLHGYTLGSEPNAEVLCVPGGGSRKPATAETVAAGEHFLQMEGRAVFRWAVRVLADSLGDVLHFARRAPEEIDLLVLHQANVRIIEAALEAVPFPQEKVLMNLERYGNTSAGSIPLALDEAHAEGRIGRGQNLLLAGFGAGLAWGTGLLQW